MAICFKCGKPVYFGKFRHCFVVLFCAIISVRYCSKINNQLQREIDAGSGVGIIYGMERNRRINHFVHYDSDRDVITVFSETRMIALPDTENRTIVSSFVWTKHQNVMDGQTESFNPRSYIMI